MSAVSMVTPLADGEMKMEIVQWSKFHTQRTRQSVNGGKKMKR